MTALAFSADFLLAGEGTFLRIYSRRDEELLSSTELFIGQAIHGIVIHEGSDCIIVWGGSSVRTLKILPAADDELPPVLIVSPPARAPDWILDISFRPARTEIKTDQGIEAALITAHNALFTLKPDPLHEEAPVLTGLTSTSKCILYSAHVAWNGPNDALVASGTAFGEIIVWSCELSPTQPAEAKLHQILTGHEGSIFGVKISDPILPGSEGHPSRLLATCSDDRTIRLWDIPKLPQTAIDPQTAANAITARETGFGANLEGLFLGETTTSSCIAKGWGHLSRIWDVKFIPSCTKGVLLHLVSFGEDATCQYWDLLSPEDNSEGNSHAYKLLHQGSSALHAGKNIWASAITATTDGRVTVATGAADGSVALRTKAIPFQPPESRTQEWSIEQLVAAAAQSGASRDKLRGYAYIGNGQLLVVRDTGSILKLRTAVEDARGDEDQTQCECIAQEDSLRGYSVVTSLPSHSIAFMAGIQGAILFYHPRTGIRELANYKGKVAALFPQYHEDPSTRRETITLLATTVEAGRALVFTIALPLSSSSKLEVTQMALNLPTGFVVTGFTMICADSGNRQRIVLGARDGSLAVFEAQKGADLVEQQAWVCNQLLRGAHGRDAVTALAWVQGPTNHLGWIFSAGRDGSLTVHEAALGQDTPQLLLVHRADLPLGNNLEGLFVDADTGRLLVWGFRSKHFALYDVIAERELMAVDCGGANRTWCFHLASDCNGGALAWTKASKLLTTDLKGWNDRVIHGGGHGREIKEVAISPFIGEDSSQLIATGAEDTDIKLSEYTRDQSGQGQFRCVRTLRKHNTGIQHLQWSEDGNYLFSSGGFEEFYVWRIRRVPVLGVAVVCASACPPESELPDLRIMSFSATRAKQLESGDTATARFLISMVYSDSTTKVRKALIQDQSLVLIYHQRPSSTLLSKLPAPGHSCTQAIISRLA